MAGKQTSRTRRRREKEDEKEGTREKVCPRVHMTQSDRSAVDKEHCRVEKGRE